MFLSLDLRLLIYSLVFILFGKWMALRKKQFSSFDVAAVVRELQEKILDCRVRNIYQLDNKVLLFKLRRRDGRVFRLVLEAGRRLNLTSYSREKPMVPPSFCMALRKYLRNCWLTGVEQYKFERVVVFTFDTRTGLMRLYLELFGGGNITLVNEEGEILHALSYRRMRDRNILRGEVFRFPPPVGQNPLEVGEKEFADKLQSFGDVEVVRALAKFLGIGGFYAEEVLLRAGVDKITPCDELSDSVIEAVFGEVQGLLSGVTGGELEPCVVLDKKGGFVDVVPFRLKRYGGFEHECFGSFNKAVDEFYVRTGAIERAKAVASEEVEKLQEEADRLKRVIERQEKALAKAEDRAERNKRAGDVIYAHTGELKALLRKFSIGKKKGREWDEMISEVLAEKEAGAKPGVFFDSFDDRRLVVNVCVDGSRFGLSLKRGLFENAARFYERYKRAKRKLEGAQAALEEFRDKLKKVEARLEEAEASKEVRPVEVVEEIAERKIRRKKWFEKFRWFVSSDGFLVVAGKDAVSNEVLVKKYAEEGDVVFHADVFGAPFVVVKTEGEEVSKECLRQAGVFAAAFSRGWREGFASVDVYWVAPDQLSKSAPSGEYVPRGGFMVYGKRNWMRGAPLKLAVGVVIEDGEVKFVGGPVDSVEAKTNRYMVVVPGDVEGKTLFKQVLTALARKTPKELRKKVLEASFEEIREFIPYSKGRILED